MKKLGLLVLTLSIILSVVSCGKSHQLIGKWVGTMGTIEFFDNNTTTLGGSATWVILKDGRVKVDTQGISFLGDLKGNHLVFSDPIMGGKMLFDKVK